MYLVINKCVTAVKVSNFSGRYLRNRSTLDIGVLSYIGIVQHKEHSPEVLSIPPGTPCIERCSRSERSGMAGLLVGVLQLKGMRRNTDKGGCPLCLGVRRI